MKDVDVWRTAKQMIREYGAEAHQAIPEKRARVVLGLDDCEPKALPPRVEHLWRAENFAGHVPYTGTFLLPLGPAPDMALLQQSIAAIVARHEALRSRLALNDCRAILVPGKPKVESLQCVDAPRADIEQYRQNRPGSPLTRFFTAPADLFEQTGFRCRAFRDEDGNVSLGVWMHHYFGDAWSSQILRSEIEAAYAAVLQGGTAEFSPVAQYSDYALFQRQSLDKNLARRLAYWRDRLESAPPSNPPFDQAGDKSLLGRAHFLIENDLMLRLAALGRQERVSLALVCFAAFQIALAKWCGVTEIVSSVQSADRIRPQFRQTIGFLQSAIAIFSKLPQNLRYREFLLATARQLYDGIAHQDLAFELYDEIFAPPQPFCTSRFNFTPRQENFFVGTEATPVIDGVQHSSDIPKVSAYRDLQFLVIEYPQGLVCRAVYNKNLSFEKIAELIRLYQGILAAVAADPGITIGQFL